MGRVIVFGSLNMDLSIACERMPRAGETITGGDFLIGAGGKGANQASAAARMGAEVDMIGAVGVDVFGERLVEGLRADGVGCSHVTEAKGATTGVAVITRCEGDNRIVLDPGANHLLDADAVARALDGLVGGDGAGSVFLVQLECDVAATLAALACAHQRGMCTVFNPAPARELPVEVWRHVDVACLNETECVAITGIMPVDEASCTAALKKIEELTDGGMGVITLGSAGSVALIDDDFMHVPAQRCEAVDTTGAGDTYIGVFAAARAAGELIFECMIQASFASGLAVTRLGAPPSLPTWEEVVAWMMGW